MNDQRNRKLRETALMRHNWMEGSFNLIKAKSVLVSQCEDHNLQRAIMWQRGEEVL